MIILKNGINELPYILDSTTDQTPKTPEDSVHTQITTNKK